LGVNFHDDLPDGLADFLYNDGWPDGRVDERTVSEGTWRIRFNTEECEGMKLDILESLKGCSGGIPRPRSLGRWRRDVYKPARLYLLQLLEEARRGGPEVGDCADPPSRRRGLVVRVVERD
jgi:hypothetical protein